MPEMPSCALLLASHHTDAPFKKHLKVLIRAVFKVMPLLLDKRFKFRKELFDRFEVRCDGKVKDIYKSKELWRGPESIYRKEVVLALSGDTDEL
jgi:hypothetical protein